MTETQEKAALVRFRRVAATLAQAAAPFAGWGDGNCGFVLAEVQAALRNAGLYAEYVDRQPEKARIPQWLRTQVFERDAYRCVRCDSYKSLHADHITPESKGGLTTLQNLQTLCAACNLKKGAALR